VPPKRLARHDRVRLANDRHASDDDLPTVASVRCAADDLERVENAQREAGQTAALK